MDKQTDSKKGKVISLIGAGASISVGIPAMEGIFNDFMDYRKSGITKEQKELCNLFIDELKVNRDLEEFLLAANLIIEAKDSCLLPLVRRSISKQKNTSKIDSFNLNFLSKIEQVKKLKESILKYMAQTCFMFERESALKYYSDFITSVAKIGIPIFTTNYDFVPEYIAEEKNLKVIDNFNKSGRRSLWNGDVDYPLGGGLTIIKLHGSVSWYVDDKGTIEKIQSDTKINTMGKLTERMVVFPTRFKDIYDQHFFTLYSHFLSSLGQANLLIIIGHSLRDEYLRAAIIERFRKGNMQILVVSPDFPNILPKELSPVKIGSLGKIMHIPYKFEYFSDELAYMLEKFDINEIGKQVNKIINHNKYAKDKIQIKGRIRKLIPNQSLDIIVKVKSFIKKEFKPSYIKAWLGIKIKLPDGKFDNRISKEFIQNNAIRLGDKVTGFIDEEFKIKISIPHVKYWLENVEVVELKVAILSKDVKRPNNISNSIVIATDTKKLNYGF